MPKLAFIEKTFQPKTLAVIRQANAICAEYAAQGLNMTLRQLYYQFVARGLIRNKQTEYDRLGSIVNDARLAGLLDWNYIVDLTRSLTTLPHWNSGAEAQQSIAEWYLFDKWASQERRVEVWIEKEALAGVIEPVCRELDVPYYAVRGYNSQSGAFEAWKRVIQRERNGQQTLIIHLGDHDPSGIDMTRDNRDRFLMMGRPVEVKRIALNMDQVEQYDPPPNPAKLTDSRVGDYMARYGASSWELDALPPDVLTELIRDAVAEVRDEDAWREAVATEQEHRRVLEAVSDRWDEVTEYLS